MAKKPEPIGKINTTLALILVVLLQQDKPILDSDLFEKISREDTVGKAKKKKQSEKDMDRTFFILQLRKLRKKNWVERTKEKDNGDVHYYELRDEAKLKALQLIQRDLRLRWR